MEATTSSSIEALVHINVLYTRSLSCIDNELRRFWSYLKWICIDQSDARHVMVLGLSSFS
ncbi:hypothetical protein BHE74_00037695 [Ensete ventricosum]|nr:hypothetical protein GW17_00052938 [Ensete ventricosum]RWW55653.1 hypothetical protein BHE74_00037695 [Ensete ventricosum]